jgi:hypothetical protein
MWIAVPALCAAILVPAAMSSGSAVFESADAMLRRWEGNGSAFEIVRWAWVKVLGALHGAGGPDEIVHLQWMDAPARALEGTFFSLHKDGPADPLCPGAFTIGDIALALSKLVAGLAVLAVAARAFARRHEAARAGLWIMGALTIVTPVLHPWYALSILAFAAIRRAWPWLVLGALLPLSYLPLDGWWANGEWSQPGWIYAAEYGPFLAAAALYAMFSSQKR